jgi:hypothetical protein
MMPAIPLKKLVVELRYKPNLGFYGKIDSVAMGLAEKFPDWERSPLTVEIRNKKAHRRLFLSYKRLFYECDLQKAEASSEFENAAKTLDHVGRRLELDALTRIGVRQWFCADLEKTFALMVDEFDARFLGQTNELKQILTDKAEDLAYVVDYETNDAWKYHLRLGPMTRDEWFQRVAFEANVFEAPEGDDSATFEKYRTSVPENFLYLDVDCYQEEIEASRVKELMTMFRRRSHDVAGKLISYCKG